MHPSLPWILVLALTTIADVLVRTLTGFDMPRVLAAEALIFPVSAVVLGLLRHRAPASGNRTRALQTVLVWTFALAGIRSAMIALGSSYAVASAVPVGLAVVGIQRAWRRRKAGASASAATVVAVCAALGVMSCGTERPGADDISPSGEYRSERGDAVSPPGSEGRVPRDLLVAEGACPFECCTYREWRAPVPLPRLDSPMDGSPVDTIQPGETFEAVTGTVFVTGIQLIAVLDSLDGSGEPGPAVTTASPWTAVFLPGDTLVALDYLGEGFYRAWDGAETHEVQQFWWPADADEPAPDWASHGRSIGKYGSEWWIRSVRTDGVEGWFRAPDRYIPGSDACGVD